MFELNFFYDDPVRGKVADHETFDGDYVELQERIRTLQDCGCYGIKEKDISPKVTAMRTLKNAFDQVLFEEGKEYKIADEDEKRYYVLNELDSETTIRKNELLDNFVFVRTD